MHVQRTSNASALNRSQLLILTLCSCSALTKLHRHLTFGCGSYKRAVTRCGDRGLLCRGCCTGRRVVQYGCSALESAFAIAWRHDKTPRRTLDDFSLSCGTDPLLLGPPLIDSLSLMSLSDQPDVLAPPSVLPPPLLALAALRWGGQYAPLLRDDAGACAPSLASTWGLLPLLLLLLLFVAGPWLSGGTPYRRNLRKHSTRAAAWAVQPFLACG
jgi:hypothetical protein